MAVYKVPQDVETDDKLLGPFTFRQFIYLIIVVIFAAVGWALIQIAFPLVLLVVPPIVFFSILALPFRKDQPMETYVAALFNFYTKPRKRFWMPGQKEKTITIEAPKSKEEIRSKGLTSEEASKRLSFLAKVIDSEGYIVSAGNSSMRQKFYQEAQSEYDMLGSNSNSNFHNMSPSDQAREAMISQMRASFTPPNTPVSSPNYQTPPLIHQKYNH